jgi:RNase P subunit RPR2
MKSKEKILTEIENLIGENAKSNKKAKILAMRNNIKLRELRKKFCQNCYRELVGKTRIKKKRKVITCKNCGKIYRFKLKD